MELALNKPSSCVDCCKDCTLLPCCSASACCDASCDAACGLIPPDPVRYEYQEPEENFISIDDVKIKSFLWQIGQQQREKDLEIKRIMEQEKREKREKERREAEKRRDQEVIELDEEEAQSPRGLIISAARSLAHWNSSIRRVTPDIELIPRRVHRVVAEIELSDSDHDEDSEVDEDVSLPSNAVSCVLNEQRQDGSQNPQELVIIVPSDQEDEQKTDNVIKRKSSGSRRLVKRRPGANRRGRHMYECPDCGKKVQSNYNLRRHMMIHTGTKLRIKYSNTSTYHFLLNFPQVKDHSLVICASDVFGNSAILKSIVEGTHTIHNSFAWSVTWEHLWSRTLQGVRIVKARILW